MTESYAVAMDKASQFRAKKAQAQMSFLELAVLAKEIKDSKCWKEIGDGTWGGYCEDREVGLGEPVSSVNNLINIIDTYISNRLLTAEEANQAGWSRLQMSMATVKKIPVSEHGKVKDVLLEEGTPADIKDSLRDLVPEDVRKPINHIEAILRHLSKAWQEMNNISVDEVGHDDAERITAYIEKIDGWFVRRGK